MNQTIMLKPEKSQYLIILLFSTLLFSACTKSLTQISPVYENNFDNDSLKGIETLGWLPSGMVGTFPYNKITAYNNNKMLGLFNNCAVLLNFDHLPPHDNIKVEFDLYLHDNWKNDIWKLTFDGQDHLLTGFSNDSSILQSYPDWYNAGIGSPAGNQAQEIYLPGICSLKNSMRGTSRYKIINNIVHTADSFSIVISDAGGAVNDTCNRSWAIDNLKIVTLKN